MLEQPKLQIQLLSPCSRACEPQLLSPRATTTAKSVDPELMLCHKRNYCNEKPTQVQGEMIAPAAATREALHIATKTHHSQEVNNS